MSLDKPWDQISEDDILRLKENAVPEDGTLDYKRELPGPSDSEKMEFRADVCSFANAAGGHIIFGIEEAGGTPVAIPGLTDPNPDATILRLQSILLDRIQPRLPLILMKSVLLPSIGSSCLLVRIPLSWSQPHGVIQTDHPVFYSRATARKFRLDVPQLRAAFLQSESTSDRIRAFRAQRIGMILAKETPVLLADSPKAVFHLIPVSALSTGATVDVTAVCKETGYYQRLETWGWHYRYNLDGLLVHTRPPAAPQDSETAHYMQVFRNGIIEAVDASTLRGEVKRISGIAYENVLLNRLVPLLQTQATLGVPLPVFLMLTFTGVKGFSVGTDFIGHERMQHTPIDRDVLVLPEALVEDYNTTAEQLMLPILNAFWGSAGWERSPTYDEDGNRKPEFRSYN